MRSDERVLLTGVTGYIGGRLLAALERQGRTIRCLARRPQALSGRVAGTTEVLPGDCLSPETLAPAFGGVHTAYYLVDSMGSGEDFAELDRRAARNFGQAARAAGAKRIVYLGGLGASEDGLSEHLRSRHSRLVTSFSSNPRDKILHPITRPPVEDSSNATIDNSLVTDCFFVAVKLLAIPEHSPDLI